MWFGEWGLPTQFNATDEFLFQWADAQKLAYSQGAGWIVSQAYATASRVVFADIAMLVLELQGGNLRSCGRPCTSMVCGAENLGMFKPDVLTTT